MTARRSRHYREDTSGSPNCQQYFPQKIELGFHPGRTLGPAAQSLAIAALWLAIRLARPVVVTGGDGGVPLVASHEQSSLLRMPSWGEKIFCGGEKIIRQPSPNSRPIRIAAPTIPPSDNCERRPCSPRCITTSPTRSTPARNPRFANPTHNPPRLPFATHCITTLHELIRVSL